jgi:hypothetical protein
VPQAEPSGGRGATPRRAVGVSLVLAGLALVGGPVLGATLGEHAHAHAIALTCAAPVLATSVPVMSTTTHHQLLAAVVVRNASPQRCNVGGFYLPVGAPLPNEIVRVGPPAHQLLLANATLSLAPHASAAFLVVGPDLPAAFQTPRGVLHVRSPLPGAARVSVSPLFPSSKLSAIVAAARESVPS